MLYNDENTGQNGQVSQYTPEMVEEMVKAISAGQSSGTVLDGTLTSGSALKYESLEATLKNLTFNNSHFVFYNRIAKKPATSTNEEYNQLVDYGTSGKYSTLEGELPEESDSSYRRMSEFVKYKGIVGSVTDVARQVKMQIDPYAQEVKNKMTLLLQSIEKELHYGNSAVDPLEFDGVFRLHRKLIGGTNADYFNSAFNLDVRGAVLAESHVNELTSNIVGQGYGAVTDIFAPHSVFKNFVDQKYDQRRIMTNTDVQSGKFGQRVTEFITQYGNLNPNSTIFGTRTNARLTTGATAAAQHPKAPAAITPDGSTPLAATTDTTTQFGSAYAGDYFIAVAAVNQYGEGAMTALSSSALTVAATEVIDGKFTITDNAYPATGFVIYRSEKDPAGLIGATSLYPVFSITIAERTAGYDGAGAGVVRDKNYDIPNTEKAFIYEAKNSQIMSIKELGKMKKLDLAITSPKFRFAILYYLTNILYQPKKLGVINNIGAITS